MWKDVATEKIINSVDKEKKDYSTDYRKYFSAASQIEHFLEKYHIW